MNRYAFLLLSAASLLFLGFGIAPSLAYAAVGFSEVMYDAPGADADHEWIEVYNDTSSSIDLSAWKLSENGTNHTLTPVSGGNIVAAGAYAIIAEEPNVFESDYPGFSGVIFDSSFSLNNSGETIELIDAAGSVADSFTYASSQGANDDGNSLQLNTSNGVWTPADPTPGKANTTYQAHRADDEDDSSYTYASTHEGSRIAVGTPHDESAAESSILVSITAGPDRQVLVGEPLEFGTEMESGKVRYLWNFGDGGRAEGELVHHRYERPGTYIIVLEAVNGDSSAIDRAKMTVVPANVHASISYERGEALLHISNSIGAELDLSGWSIRSGAATLLIPYNTIVLPQTELVISLASSKFAAGEVTLVYPDGTVLVPPDAPVAHFATTPVRTRTLSVAKAAPVPEAAEAHAAEADPIADQSASVVLSAEEGKSLTPWIAGLVLFLLAGSALVLLLSRPRSTEAETLRIIDETNDERP